MKTLATFFIRSAVRFSEKVLHDWKKWLFRAFSAFAAYLYVFFLLIFEMHFWLSTGLLAGVTALNFFAWK